MLKFLTLRPKKKQANHSKSTLEKNNPVSCFESTAGGGATASDASSASARGANAAGGGGNGSDCGSHSGFRVIAGQLLEGSKVIHEIVGF